MKRKKLLEFATFLSNTRRQFCMGSHCDCISGHAQTFFRRNVRDASAVTLKEAFDLTAEQAHSLWGGPFSATRKAAAECLRFLAKTGQVNWPRAFRVAKVKVNGVIY